jgi:hypothetical protein
LFSLQGDTKRKEEDNECVDYCCFLCKPTQKGRTTTSAQLVVVLFVFLKRKMMTMIYTIVIILSIEQHKEEKYTRR